MTFWAVHGLHITATITSLEFPNSTQNWNWYVYKSHLRWNFKPGHDWTLPHIWLWLAPPHLWSTLRHLRQLQATLIELEFVVVVSLFFKTHPSLWTWYSSQVGSSGFPAADSRTRFNSCPCKLPLRLSPLTSGRDLASKRFRVREREEISGNLGSVLELTQVGVPVVE